jgi:hypothetical protein
VHDAPLEVDDLRDDRAVALLPPEEEDAGGRIAADPYSSSALRPASGPRICSHSRRLAERYRARIATSP